MTALPTAPHDFALFAHHFKTDIFHASALGYGKQLRAWKITHLHAPYTFNKVNNYIRNDRMRIVASHWLCKQWAVEWAVQISSTCYCWKRRYCVTWPMPWFQVEYWRGLAHHEMTFEGLKKLNNSWSQGRINVCARQWEWYGTVLRGAVSVCVKTLSTINRSYSLLNWLTQAFSDHRKLSTSWRLLQATAEDFRRWSFVVSDQLL